MAGSLALLVLMIMLVFPMGMTASLDSSSAAETNFLRAGKMTFDEDWKSDAAPSTCTCTCHPAAPSPSSQRSPVERKRSPPPSSPVYWPSPSSPVSKSPISKSPPYGDVPSYEQPSPVVVTSPQTFVPSPPPPPAY